uniref:hypothetical protein n=1 Tax=Dietzia lutea TaxID=546160 RepID=UPI001330D556
TENIESPLLNSKLMLTPASTIAQDRDDPHPDSHLHGLRKAVPLRAVCYKWWVLRIANLWQAATDYRKPH